MIKTMKTMLLVASLLVFLTASSQAQIRDDLAIRAIIGEASNQGYEGMRAVASALRNRGTLKGVYGLNAKHINREPKKTWELARRAWAESAKVDVVGGSTHWDNIRQFGRPYWLKDMRFVIQVRDHHFYRQKHS